MVFVFSTTIVPRSSSRIQSKNPLFHAWQFMRTTHLDQDILLICKILADAGTCVCATSALDSSGRVGEEESVPCVVRLSKTSSKPTDRNHSFQNVERKFYTVIPVIFNKTGTLPFERNVLAIMANFDLAVVISLKFQIDFKTCRVNHQRIFG